MQSSHIALIVLLCLAGAIHETEAQYWSYYYPSYSYYGYPYYNYGYNYGYNYYPYSYYYTYGKRSVDYNQAPQGNNGQQFQQPQQQNYYPQQQQQQNFFPQQQQQAITQQ